MYHHGEDHNIWTYCVHLGPYTHDGINYDLGIYEEGILGPSFAIVTGEEPHEYISGEVSCVMRGVRDSGSPRNPVYEETIKRYEEYKQQQEE